jgi:Uma2 family endonuclease
MTMTANTVTADDVLAMGAKGRFLEVIEGEARAVLPANIRHGDIASQIGMILRQYVSPRKLGRVIIEGGYILARNPDTMLAPDVSFLRQSRIPAGGLPEKFFDGFPDLAVEIISPTNPRAELKRKMKTYLDHGTELAWLVDPNMMTVDIYRPKRAARRVKRSDQITGDQTIAGFSVVVSEFFA